MNDHLLSIKIPVIDEVMKSLIVAKQNTQHTYVIGLNSARLISRFHISRRREKLNARVLVVVVYA